MAKEKETKEFDRSICFTYFGNYYKQVKLVEKQFGLETAYKVNNAIIEYGLFGTEITDETIRMLVAEPTLDLIDSSQKRRSKGFGEDLAKTQAVKDYYRDHPEASQNQIAKATGVSKGKVNSVLKKLRAESTINNDSDNGIDTDNDTMTVTDDRSTEYHSDEFTDSIITEDQIKIVYSMFQNGNNYDLISNKTKLKRNQIYNIIKDGKIHDFKFPSERTNIHYADGRESEFKAEDIIVSLNNEKITYQDCLDTFELLCGENSEYKLNKKEVINVIKDKTGFDIVEKEVKQ